MSRSRSRSHSRSNNNENEQPTLYIRNINRKTTNKVLSEIFSKYGEIKDIHIPVDYYTKEVRGFAYIKYKSHNDAEDALKNLNNTEIDGRVINISWAEGTRKTSYDMKRKDNRSSSRRDRSRSRRSRSRDRRSSRRDRSRSSSRSRSRSHHRSHRSKRSYTRSRSRDHHKSRSDKRYEI